MADVSPAEQNALANQFDDLMSGLNGDVTTTTTTETSDGKTVTMTTTTLTNGDITEEETSSQSVSEQSLAEREARAAYIRQQRESSEDTGRMPVRLPSEQDMLPFKSLGVDYTKVAYERSLSGTTRQVPVSPGGTPVNRLPEIEKVAPPQITQNVRAMFETGDLPDKHEVKRMDITIHENVGAGVFENDPTPREGVTRETDHSKDEFQEGYTRNLRQQWLDKENEQPQIINRGPVKLAEDDGCILESEPVVRTDVLRESDNKDDPHQVLGEGHASTLVEKFLNMKDEFPLDHGPVKLYDENEAGPVVYENEPSAPRADVVRDAQAEERIRVQKGKAKNLKTFFSNQPEYQKENRPLDIAEDGGIVLESQPVYRQDVIRESDVSESDKSIRFEAGRSRNMVSMWQNKRDDYQPKQFKMDVEANGPTVIENEPTVREDVIRESHVQEEQLGPGEGHTRQLADRFLSQNDDDGRRGPKDMIEIERGNEPEVVESTPIERTDVVKCDISYTAGDPEVQSGMARGLVNQWLNTNDDVLLAAKMSQDTRPRWQMELEEAQKQKEQMVDDSEEERDATDGFSGEDINDHNALIPEKHTSSLKNRWQQMQEEEEARLRRDRCPEPVRFTPPREVTPPPLKQPKGHQSYQKMTFNQPQQQPQEQVANGYPEQNSYQSAPPSGNQMTSKRVISLKSS